MLCLSCLGDYEREGANEGKVTWSESNIFLFLLVNFNEIR